MCAKSDPISDIDALIKRLIAAATSFDGEAQADAHKQLFSRGQSAASALAERLLKSDFREIERSEKLLGFSAMYSLLHEIDSHAANDVGSELLERNCHALVAVEIERISSHLESDFDVSEIDGLRIHYSRQLKFPEFAKRKMDRWILAVPSDHLAGIAAVYVMPPRGCGEGALGTYTSDFKRICIEWDEYWHPRNPLTWLTAPVILPRTFYHEVGHHVLGHTNGPRDEDEERAVNHYATMRCLKASRGLSMFVNLLNYSSRAFRWRRVTSRNFAHRLQDRWTEDAVPLRPGATRQALSDFQCEHGCELPAPLETLLQVSDGMKSQGFCSNGFKFRGLEEFEIITRKIGENDDEPTKLVLFADHLPNDVHYGMPVRECGCRPCSVFRTGCRTPSECLEVASSLSHFVRLYLRNQPILFA